MASDVADRVQSNARDVSASVSPMSESPYIGQTLPSDSEAKERGPLLLLTLTVMRIAQCLSCNDAPHLCLDLPLFL